MVCYGVRDSLGRFVKGVRSSPGTEFKKGTHWRKHKPYWDRDWLCQEYVVKARPANEIAAEFGITENAILFWLHKHGIPRRSMVEIRAIKYWGSSGEDNPMFDKRGPRNHNWSGGHTPFRQRIYGRFEWLRFVRKVRERDKVCRLCGSRESLRTHHIDPVRQAPLLIMDMGNVILLCESCHQSINGKENQWKQRLYKLIEES